MTGISMPQGVHHLLNYDACTTGNSLVEDSAVFVLCSFSANTLDGSNNLANETPVCNCPEVGVTTSTTMSTAAAVADNQGVNQLVTQAGAENSDEVWECLLWLTKITNLPDLLDCPCMTPDFVPLAPAERPSINKSCLNPVQPGSSNFHLATKLSALPIMALVPKCVSKDVWHVVESLTLEETIG
ncbi:hypothetical protein LPJ66_000922 [Kickxella alabastrina]|uniref:Uncharacterized protein n=1 Tax=Kickxella alabastrina TaxID=61397 RepID=A0ACC1IUR5_9FUNG|nr:hypothetical protein LPJ66_000922 [Kickxella alabastrina]